MNQDETSEGVLLKARNAVYRLLKVRMRSEKEVRDRLKIKEFPLKTIDQTIQYFQEAGLIDDREFAKRWVTERLSKPLGLKRIRFELRNKGIEPSLFEDVLAEIKADYSEETIIRTLMQRKAARYRGKQDKLELRQRMQDYLLRRGFDPQTVYKAVKEI